MHRFRQLSEGVPGAARGAPQGRPFPWIRYLARRFVGDRAGVTSLEYALMGLLVFAAVAGSLYGYGGGLSVMLASTFQTISGQM